MLLVALRGMPGSGKSTLGRAISKRLGWPIIDKDDVKDLIDGHCDDSGTLAYEVMFNIARRQLQQGLNVICDSPLTYASLYEQARRVADDTGARLVVLECVCSDEEEWQRRVDARQEMGLPGHHMSSWEKLQGYRLMVEGKVEYPVGVDRLVLDTVRPLEEIVEEAMGWLRSL
ncbi:MAG: ATP-binding protein [Chloroflexota bacterium]|nr:ATP-binding protein [Chloroflexota bacterium]MDQ5867590.1 ATP-binding protein [Chloroflexota bacterium]